MLPFNPMMSIDVDLFTKGPTREVVSVVKNKLKSDPL